MLEKWAGRNLMKFNKNKCKVLYLRWRSAIIYQYMLGGTDSAEGSSAEKDVGIPAGQVENESTVCPYTKGGRLYPGLY